MKKCIFFSLIICLINLNLYSQKSEEANFDKIDKHARTKIPREIRISIGDLTNHLLDSTATDLEKVRAIYVWITHNIRYDVKATAFLGNRPDQENAVITLRTKKAVCEGYAVLFKAMCDTAQLKSHIVVGWTKGKKGKPDKVSRPRSHAWNVVFINDQWHLIDATWGAGWLKKKEFIRNFKEEYFLANPETFIFKHLPDDPIWQLLECPISFKTFKKGEAEITEKIKITSCNYSFPDSIALWENLELDERNLKSAMNAYNYHKNNMTSRQLGNVYKKRAENNAEKITEETEEEEKIQLIEKCIIAYEKSLEYFLHPGNIQQAEVALTDFKEKYENFQINYKRRRK